VRHVDDRSGCCIQKLCIISGDHMKKWFSKGLADASTGGEGDGDGLVTVTEENLEDLGEQ
jgi:hypothetical protein